MGQDCFTFERAGKGILDLHLASVGLIWCPLGLGWEERVCSSTQCLHVSHSFVDLSYLSISTAISPGLYTKKRRKQLWKPVTSMLHWGKSKYSKALSHFIHLQRRKALTSSFSLGLRHSRTSTGDLCHLRRGGVFKSDHKHLPGQF